MFDISSWFVPLARRVLYSWVKTTVFTESVAGIDSSRPVCYVLQNHYLSDMLVLLRESRAAGLPPASAALEYGEVKSPRSLFFLNRRRRQDQLKHATSPLLAGLVSEVVRDPQRDVQLVPVLVLWGRAPGTQESILGALLAETWRASGVLRQFFAILLHGRQVMVRFNAPVSLRELVHGGDAPLTEAVALRKVSRVLRVHFRRQREMAIGPDLSHRNTQVEAILGADPVRSAVAAEAVRLQITPAAAQLRARGFALEIASDYSYGVVRALELFLRWLWEHLYDGIEVHNLEALLRIAPGQGIVYVPCHRSHMDYLLLSYLIHKNGMTPPHIAAGANLNMPLLGGILRRAGAFFLRRSFKGEPLYAAVFHEYLHLMLARGFPIEYYIEGGRSRTGRTLAPKAGILGMTIASFVRSHERPLVFVPVYVGYERIMEGPTYVRELAGRPKRKESLWQLLSTLRHIKRVFGRVHVNFGEPLPLADYLDQHHAGWRQPVPAAAVETQEAPAVLRLLTRDAALALAARINEAAVINPVNLVALGLLATPRFTADRQALLRMIEHYQAIDTAAPYALRRIACEMAPAAVLAHVERLAFIERIAHPLGDLLRVPEAQVPLLGYFRNNVLHLFALPALLACLLGNIRNVDAGRLLDAVRRIHHLMGPELFLHWQDEQLAGEMERIIAVFAGRGLLRRGGADGQLVAPDAYSQEFAELHLIGETLRPTLGRHFLALSLLQERGSGCLTRRQLEGDCHLLAQRLSLLGGFSAAEVSDQSVFAVLVTHLIDSELLAEDASGHLCFDQQLVEPLAYAELVLPADARLAIRRIAAMPATLAD